MRVKAVIAYDGTPYEGFQRQRRTKQTVTTMIEDALRSLQIDSPIVGSGRTDAGVHATGQVIHFDLPYFWSDLDKLKRALNRKLTDIRFKHISRVDDDFHARFHAKKRLYRYLFKTTQPTLFERNYLAFYADFDPLLLQKALYMFEGEHDFLYFHKSGSQTHTTVREVYQAVYRKLGSCHILYFQANGFLRSQVRMMVESAMRCAQQKMTLTQLQEQLDTKKQHNTHLASQTGLYLARIIY